MVKEIKKNSVIEQSRKHDKDTGSLEVQVVALTENIARLSDHSQKNPKDFSSKRGLLKMVMRRRRYLEYLSKNDNENYQHLIERLELRK